MKKEVRWVIVGKYGLYVGQCLTRKDMIAEHIKGRHKTWEECKKLGDRCVKADIFYEVDDVE